MIEEIKTDNNCIIKAFENNPISILKENIEDKRVYYFRASDIGKVLGIVNIRTSIMNFDEDEKASYC
jgi:prophage antirepressor-like protein